MENNKLIINENGKEVGYRVLLNVEDVEGKNYVLYTNEKIVDGEVECYAAEYEMVNDKPKLKSIKDDKTWEFLKDLLNSIQNGVEE